MLQRLMAFAASMVAIIGCQQILGIDEGIELTEGAGAMGGGAEVGGAPSQGGGGAGGSQGGGGAEITPAACDDKIAPLTGSAIADDENPSSAAVCGPENIELEDGQSVGLARTATGAGALYAPSSDVDLLAGACIEVDFGQVWEARGARLVLRSTEVTCGHMCSGEGNCNTGHTGHLFISADAPPNDVWMIAPTAAFFDTGGDTLHELIITFGEEPIGVRRALVCRANEGALRDSLEVDAIQLCTD